MTRFFKAVFVFLCAVPLLLLTASAVLADSPPPPRIISVTPNADGTAEIVVQGGNNFMPSEGSPAGWFEYYPRHGTEAASGTGPFDANHGGLYTVPNHSAILSVVSVNPENNTTTYRLNLRQGDLAENAQIGNQVTVVITQCIGSDDNQSGPSNAVTFTVGDPSTAYSSEDSDSSNTETPTAAPTEPPYVLIPTSTPPILAPTEAPHQHAWEKVKGKEPTCTEKGYSDYEKCECGASRNYQAIPALGHDWCDEWYFDCDSSGHPVHEHVCNRAFCEAIKDREPCVFKRDENGNIVTEPFDKDMAKQDEPFYVAYKGPAGYTWDEVDLDEMPSHEIDGLQVAVCTVCGKRCLVQASPYAVIATSKPTGEVYAPVSTEAPHEHFWFKVEGKEPTCTEPGYTDYENCVCGAKRYYQEFPALSHDWSTEWTPSLIPDPNSLGERVHYHKCTRPGCDATTEPEPCVPKCDENGKLIAKIITIREDPEIYEKILGLENWLKGKGEAVPSLGETTSQAISGLLQAVYIIAIEDGLIQFATCTKCGQYLPVDIESDSASPTPAPPPAETPNK